jgi:bifunctional oligoribonuclease and PAP phosphatase NrnA
VSPVDQPWDDLPWDAVVEVLRAAPEVALACHVAPDGDALGSMLALGLGLRRRGVRVVASWGEPGPVVPEAYRELPGLDLLVPPDEVPDQPAVMVTLDTGSLDRLGLLADAAKSARCVVVVDHHPSNTGFGDHLLVDSSAPATAVLVDELLRRLDVALDAEIAAPLYAGLSTDTGSFRYAATTSHTHQMAARLLATGIRHDLIARAVYDTAPFGYVQVLGAACSRAVLEPAAAGGLGLVWTVITAEDRAAAGLGMAQVEAVIDAVRVAQEAEVAVVCKVDDDGTVKVSTRSKGQVDVGALCTALGGGGHRFAAGFTAHGSCDAALAAVRERLAAAPHLTG